jgi:hypothetical protein
MAVRPCVESQRKRAEMERNQDEVRQRYAEIPRSNLESSRQTAMSVRDSGLRRIRRMSNCSLAALVVGVGATTGALARTVPSATVGTTAVTNAGTVTSTVGGVVQQAPSIHTPVATTSASGVTTSVSGASGVTVPAEGNGRSIASGSGDS